MRKTLFCTLLSGCLLSAGALKADEKIDFEKQIYPLIKASCVKCHQPKHEDDRGRSRKPKGGIVMTSKEDITTAVDEDDNKILVAGDPDKSRILQVTLLPLDDEYHFPPEGKAPQWTKKEKDLFAKWIKDGADFGKWTADPKPHDLIEWDGKEKE